MIELTRAWHTVKAHYAVPAPVAAQHVRWPHALIIGGGAVVLGIMLWAHLGLSTLLAPAVGAPGQQVAQAGGYRLTVRAQSAYLVEHPVDATLTLTDANGKLTAGAQVSVQPQMLTMPMRVPASDVMATGPGAYLVRSTLPMAGPWRLLVTVSMPGQPEQHVSFPVEARFA